MLNLLLFIKGPGPVGLRVGALRRIKGRKWLTLDGAITLGVFIFWFNFYRLFLAPSAYHGDAAEYATVIPVLGITHPPGYPVLTLVGYLFSLLPIGNPAYRVNLMSAVFAAGSVSMSYLICQRVYTAAKIRGGVPGRGAAILFISLFALSPPLWDFAEYASVRSLETFFLALTLLLVLRWAEVPSARDPRLPVGVFGFALAAHTSIVLYLPAVAAFMVWMEPTLLRPRRLGAVAPFVLIGPLLYLYVLIRSLQGPPFAWGLAPDLASWIGYVRGDAFRANLFAYGLRSVPSRALSLQGTLTLSYAYPALLFIGAGGYVLLRRSPRTLILLGPVALVNAVFFANYRGADYGMFIPALLVLAALGAVGVLASMDALATSVGAWWAPNILSPSVSQRVVSLALLASIFFLPLASFQTSVPYLDRSHDDSADFSLALLRSVPLNSVLLTSFDNKGWDYTLEYFQKVGHIRMDVTIRGAAERDWRVVAQSYLASGYRVFVPEGNRSLGAGLYQVPYLISFGKVGALEVVSTPPSPLESVPSHGAPPILGSELALLSFSMETSELAEGILGINLSWTTPMGTSGGYGAILRLIAPAHIYSANLPLGYGLYPPSTWGPGVTFQEHYLLAVPNMAGNFELQLSLLHDGVEVSGSPARVGSATLNYVTAG